MSRFNAYTELVERTHSKKLIDLSLYIEDNKLQVSSELSYLRSTKNV